MSGSNPWLSTVLVGALVAVPALAAETPHSTRHAKDEVQVVEIAVTAQGFVPAATTVKAGRPVKLVVTRKVERTCATEIILKDYGVNKPLPLGQAVEVAFTPKKAGPVRYSCGMNMIAGILTVE